jgi:hypothetical protein
VSKDNLVQNAEKVEAISDSVLPTERQRYSLEQQQRATLVMYLMAAKYRCNLQIRLHKRFHLWRRLAQQKSGETLELEVVSKVSNNSGHCSGVLKSPAAARSKSIPATSIPAKSIPSKFIPVTMNAGTQTAMVPRAPQSRSKSRRPILKLNVPEIASPGEDLSPLSPSFPSCSSRRAPLSPTNRRLHRGSLQFQGGKSAECIALPAEIALEGQLMKMQEHSCDEAYTAAVVAGASKLKAEDRISGKVDKDVEAFFRVEQERAVLLAVEREQENLKNAVLAERDRVERTNGAVFIKRLVCAMIKPTCLFCTSNCLYVLKPGYN